MAERTGQTDWHMAGKKTQATRGLRCGVKSREGILVSTITAAKKKNQFIQQTKRCRVSVGGKDSKRERIAFPENYWLC
jgi:hypothetical protein